MTKITTASKKALSLMLAMIMAFSCLAIAASATGSFVIDKSICKLDTEKKTITVTASTYNYELQNYNVDFAITPAADKQVLYNRDTLFYNLEAGKTYVVSATITPADVAIPIGDPYEIKLKNSQNAPESPVPVKVMAKSIEIKAVSGAEYACIPANSDVVPVYGAKTEFTGLTAESQYTILIRYAETDNAYASSPASINIKTLKAGDHTVPATPVLADKTDVSITVVPIEDYEYSIDGGKTWQFKNIFTGLKPNTAYSIIARKAFESETQEENPSSEPLVIITTKRAPYIASIDKCKFEKTSEDPVYAERAFEFKITCDAPANANEVVYGDTRYIPFSYENNQVAGTKYFSSSSNKGTTVASAQGTLNIKVSFIKQKYTGSKWEDVALESKTFKVEVGSKFGYIFDGFKKFINLFLNTIPAAISKFLSGGSLSKIFDAIGNIGKTN